MSAAPPPEIAAFLGYLAARGVDHCVLHAASPAGPLSGGGDLDLYVERSALPEVTGFLTREGWREDDSERFRRARRYWSRVAGGRKLKIDLSLAYAVYGPRTCWVLRGSPEKRVGPDGYPYLSDALGAAFAARKALTKGRELPAGLLPQDVEPLFSEERCGGFSPWGWLRARWRWVRPARGRLVVALVGLDGAGKGTQADLLDAELTRRGFHVGRLYLGYSAFRLGLLRAVIAGRDRRTTRLGRTLLHAGYLALLPLEFAARRGVGLYDVLLTDRHPRYEPVFPQRPDGVFDRLLAALCPRPDLVLYLAGDGEELWRRKREMDPAAFHAKGRALDELVGRRAASASTVRVDATLPVHEVFRQLVGAVEARLV